VVGDVEADPRLGDDDRGYQPFGSAVAFLLTGIILVLLSVSYKTTKRGAEVRVL
jgi:hypothetical protein